MRFRQFLLVVTALTILSSCGGKKSGSDPLSYIPADADIVVAVDMKALSNKAQMNKVLKEVNIDGFLMMMEMMAPVGFIKDRSLTGINFDGKGYFTARLKDQVMYAVVPLKSADKFKDYVRIFDKSIKFESKSGFDWNEDLGVAIGLNKHVLVIAKAQSGQLEKAFSMKPKESLASGDNEVVRMLAEPNDVVAWFAYGDMLAHDMGQIVPADMNQMIEFWEGTTAFVTLNFNPGNVHIRFAMNPGPKAKDMWKDFTLPQPNDDLLIYTPPKTFVSAIVNLDLAATRNQMMEQGLGQLEQLSPAPWTAMLSAFDFLSGSAALFVSATSDTSGGNLDPDISVALGIKNKASMDSLINQLKADTSIYADFFKDVWIEIGEDAILMASTQAALAGMGKEAATPEVSNLFAKYPVAVHADVQWLATWLVSIAGGNQGGLINAEALDQMTPYLELFRSATITGDWNKDKATADLTFNLNDNTENSLFLLLRTIGKSVEEMAMF